MSKNDYFRDKTQILLTPTLEGFKIPDQDKLQDIFRKISSILNSEVFHSQMIKKQEILSLFQETIDPLKHVCKRNEVILDANGIIPLIFEIVESTNDILRNTEEIYKKNELILNLNELYQLYIQKTNLILELEWAQYSENVSHESMDATRLKTLEEKEKKLISELNQLQPNYDFFNKRILLLQKARDEASSSSSILNSQYISKTSELNKLVRNMDQMNDLMQTYQEKLGDLKKQYKNEIELKKNEDYTRIMEKASNIGDKLSESNNLKEKLQSDLLLLKSQLKDNKEVSMQSQQNLEDIEPKFRKVNEEYNSNKKSLDEIQTEIGQIRKRSMSDTGTPNKNLKTKRPNGETPALIRYSSIILSDINENEEKISQLTRSLGLPKDSVNSLETVSNLLVSYHEKILEKTAQNSKINVVSNLSESFLKTFSDVMTNITAFEKDLNKFISKIDLNCQFSKLPLKELSEQYKENIKNDFDCYLCRLKGSKEKETKFEELVNHKKLYFQLGVYILLLRYFGLSLMIIDEGQLDPKLSTKINLKKSIEMFAEVISEQANQFPFKIIFITSKLTKKDISNPIIDVYENTEQNLVE